MPKHTWRNLVVTITAFTTLALAVGAVTLWAAAGGRGRVGTQVKKQPPQGTTGPVKRPPTPAQLQETWRKSMVRSARPKKGCFVVTYPAKIWREVPCGTAPNRPYGPRNGVRPQTVGNGNDFAGQVTGNTSQSEGSFDTVTGVTSENDGGSADVFSLQLNTNRFTTNACTTFHATDPGCQGWEQFIFSNSGSAFIQYWMLPFAAAGTACPAGWNSFNWPTAAQVSCFINSVSAAVIPHQTINGLAAMKLDGAVAGVNGNQDDEVSLAIGNTIFSASGDNHFPDLTGGWRFSEFNVFGDFNGTQAVFNSGSSIVVRTAVNSGAPAIPPTCAQQGFTGESNNLTLVSAPAMTPDVNWPSIIFTESNNNPTPISCDTADSIGDTHLKTFAGALYDFQASGDFVLARAADFTVQARQASGAPTWPNASVNKGIATQMGKTRVAVYIEPTRLIVDGEARDLADGRDLLLATGVQISRRGNVYAITSEAGDSVRATLNNTWMNVAVGLGHTPQPQASGLLGSPNGPAQQLVTSTGVALKEPVAFEDLYHTYADSWRVPANESLFSEATTIKAGIPDKLFFAQQLSPQDYARANAICKAAGIASRSLLEACTLDTAVLNDEAAANVFVHAPPPRHVVRPVLKPVLQKAQ